MPGNRVMPSVGHGDGIPRTRYTASGKQRTVCTVGEVFSAAIFADDYRVKPQECILKGNLWINRNCRILSVDDVTEKLPR